MFEKIFNFFMQGNSVKFDKKRLSNYYVDLFKFRKSNDESIAHKKEKDTCFLNCARRQGLSLSLDKEQCLSSYFSDLEGLKPKYCRTQRRI